MLRLTSGTPDWLELLAEAVRVEGVAILERAVPSEMLERTRAAMYDVQQRILRDVGEERLQRAGEIGVLRLMARYDEHFLRYLELPEMLAIVDRVVGHTAILHLQNGFILPSQPADRPVEVFQTRFHQDFPRVLGGVVLSLNVMVAIDPFTPDRGGTWVVPGSHQRPDSPAAAFMTAAEVCADCGAGSLLVFDSTLWHRAGHNVSGVDRLAINHQFTRSYLKQQIDYVRALGSAVVERQPPRTQQLLGWYTRVVTSLDEYYRPEDARLYRKGQG